ncbi:hypothetical protein SNE40_020123 [Patella caerulea]|uniref:Uncharacterized protein n=2 Tax=Patella caerulea TaxID=87958 RepID=A0AAN8GHJ3_PATCE
MYMASGIETGQVVRQVSSVPTHKGQQNNTSVGCLPFSHNRQHSDNFPDVLDNESYSPADSNRLDDVIRNSESQPMPSTSRVEDNSREREPHGIGYRVPGVHEQIVSNNSNEPSSVTLENSLHLQEQSENTSGRANPVQLPTYRAIHTRDINVGVSTRLDNRTDALPDLLHSHVPQPVRPVALPSQHRTPATRNERRARTSETRNQSNYRTRETPTRSTRHGHRTRTRSTSSSQLDDAVCKAPCVRCFVKLTSFRWVLVVLSLLGVCCVVTGIVLAALHAAGNSFLFLAIMFIGLGVLLVIVVGVGWKCTPRGHEPLHALFGIGDFQRRRGERRQHRPHRSRDNNWYGGVLYPEFQYRRPPPTYAASMQEYQNQLHLAQQQQQTAATPPTNPDNYSLPSSPPPSYRSRASTIHSGIHITFPPNNEDYPDSRPPTYRSRRGSAHPRPPIPREEFESMDRDDHPPADVSFAGPAGNTGVANVQRNQSASDRHHVVSQDSTVTVNGRVIEPVTTSGTVSTSANSDNSPTSSVNQTAQSTIAQPTQLNKLSSSNQSSTTTNNNTGEEPQRVETSL